VPNVPTVFMFSGQGSHYFQMGRELYERDGTFRRCMAQLDVIASHFAVSMKHSAIPVIETYLSQRQIVFQRLPVSFAFHSRWIEEAQAPFESFMRSSVRCTPGPVPLVCCEQGRTLDSASELSFWRVVRHPIRFRESIAHLEQRGMHRYIDVGPAGTFATFLKYQLPAATQSAVHAILTPFGQDQKNFTRLLSDVGVESPIRAPLRD